MRAPYTRAREVGRQPRSDEPPRTPATVGEGGPDREPPLSPPSPRPRPGPGPEDPGALLRISGSEPAASPAKDRASCLQCDVSVPIAAAAPSGPLPVSASECSCQAAPAPSPSLALRLLAERQAARCPIAALVANGTAPPRHG